MVSLKWGFRGVWAVRGVLGVRGVGYYGNRKGDMEGTHTWDNTYQLKLHVPPICCMVNLLVGLAMWGGKAVLFKLE